MTANPGGLHLATVAHLGHIWDAYLEIEDDPRRPDAFRARLRFDSPEDGTEGAGPYRTGVIIIEPSWEEAVARARAFDDRALQGLLRSVLPDEEDTQGKVPRQRPPEG